MASHARFSTFQKATALVPLALLSGAWTTSLTVTSAGAEGQDGRLPDGTSIPDQAIKAPASVSRPGEIAPGRAHRLGPQGPRGRLHERHPVGGAVRLPAGRAGHRLRGQELQHRLAADRRHRPRRVQPRPVRRQHPGLQRREPPRHLRHRAGRQQRHLQGRRLRRRAVRQRPAAATARSARCSSSRRPGRSSAWTATATASATRRTSTTRRSRPPSTSAPATRTSPPPPASGRRSTATTTARTTSTWCCRSWRPTPRATTPRCRPAPRAPRPSPPTTATR